MEEKVRQLLDTPEFNGHRGLTFASVNAAEPIGALDSAVPSPRRRQ